MVRCVLWALFLCAFLLHAAPARCEFLVYAGDLPPYNYLDANQRMCGPSVDILEEVMRRSGLAFEPGCIRHVPWARAISETEFKPWRMIMGLVRTEARSARFKWVGPYGRVRLGLVGIKSGKVRPRNIRELSQCMVGVIRGSAFVDLLIKQGFPKDRLVLVAEPRQLLRMLDVGRVDLVAGADQLTAALLERAGVDSSAYEMVYDLGKMDLYFALNLQTDDAIVARMQNALNDMHIAPPRGSSVIDAILLRHRMQSGLPMIKD